MNADTIRETLLHHLGENRYRDFLRDFVRVARRKGRLTYWMEKALADAGVRLTFQECLPVFTLCNVHEIPLVRRSVPVQKDVSDIRYSNQFERAMARSFPYAEQFRLFHEFLSSAETVELDQCDQCLEELREYMAKGAAKVIPGLILTVEDVFQVPDRGTVVTGNVNIGWKSSKIGDSVDLRMPNGQTIRTCIRDLERMRTQYLSRAAILLGDNVSVDQIPRGTQILTVNDDHPANHV